MEKVVEIQRQARENSQEYKSYLTDLSNWEAEMKRKESALNGDLEQDLPPVRSKIKKEKPAVIQKKPVSKIKSYDYDAWSKFDVDAACEEVDIKDLGPTSLDSKKSIKDKEEKLREEAQYEKEKGNNFVKLSKWQDAVSCYTRAIQLYSQDAIYYANRALCYLKLEKLNQAEKDSTRALELDPQYVKALHRRATARWKLGSLKAAAADARAALEIEPGNKDAKDLLDKVKKQMGTKGPKVKSSQSSPASTPTSPKPIPSPLTTTDLDVPEEWGGSGDNCSIVQPIEKPARKSKVPLKKIPIKEVQIGETSFFGQKISSRMKIIEIEGDDDVQTENSNESLKKQSEVSHVLENNVEVTKPIVDKDKITNRIDNIDDKIKEAANDPKTTKLEKDLTNYEDKLDSNESKKLNGEVAEKELIEINVKELKAPTTSVQFILEWKMLSGKSRAEYLKLIEPSKLPKIFQNSLESDLMSEIVRTMWECRTDLGNIASYLDGLSQVPRLSALVMFMGNEEKQVIQNLLTHCKEVECSGEELIENLKAKFEIF